MSDFPRVLYLTPAAFNHLTGSGVTSSNLFRGWPKERLATAHTDSVPTTNDVCERYYRLDQGEIEFLAPFRLLGAMLGRGVKADAVSAVSAQTADGRGGLVSRLQGDSVPQRATITTSLERWIADFKPDLLYTLLGNNAFMSLADLIRRRFKLPMVVHMMDDWPRTLYRRGILAPLERARMDRLMKCAVNTAAVNMGIGTAMCEAFSARYGQHFVPFQNCVEVDRWQSVVRSDSAAKGPPYRLMYFGSIIANAQLTTLIDVSRSVARLNEGGFPVQLDIASPPFLVAPYRDALMIHPSIRLVEPTQDDQEFYSQLAAADALVLPVNFDPESVAFIRYSMPTKVPAYMASGTPVLVIGPRGVAQVDYAADDGWGHVVDRPDAGSIDASLRRIMVDGELRESLRRRAQTLAGANHDTARVRARFQDALKAAARANA